MSEEWTESRLVLLRRPPTPKRQNESVGCGPSVVHGLVVVAPRSYVTCDGTVVDLGVKVPNGTVDGLFLTWSP